MKSGEFSSILNAYAEMLGTAGAATSRAQIATIAAVFEADSSSTVAALVKRLATIRASEATGSANLGDVLRLLSALKELLKKTAKAGVLNDISAIEKVLKDLASMDIEAFARSASEVAAPRPKGRRSTPSLQSGLIIQYKERLEAALGDDEKFDAIMRDLRSNQAMGKAETVALAKEMAGSGGRTADAALKKIWNRHRAVVIFKAKTRATGGRSAA